MMQLPPWRLFNCPTMRWKLNSLSVSPLSRLLRLPKAEVKLQMMLNLRLLRAKDENVCPDLCQIPTPLLHCYLTSLLTISQSRNLALRIDAGLTNAQSRSSASPALSPNTPAWQPTGTCKLSSPSPPAFR